MMAPMATTKKTLYHILGIPRDASADDIGMAHQMRAAELERASPPDPGALSLVHQAHEVLSNPARRAAYDASLLAAADKVQAAGQAQAPDLVVESGEEEEPEQKKRMVPLVGVGVAIFLAIFLVLHYSRSPAPAKPEEPVAEAPKPAPPPPPPKPLGAQQILPAALLSVGGVLSYEMSGRAVPVGLAIAVEPGAVITTCHAIPAGSQLVVKVGEESNSAAQSVTDELLDLCLLNVTGLNARVLAIATDEAKAGDKVFALGSNAKGEFALTEGTVKQMRMTPNVKLLELSMPIAANGSGGAVLDVYGKLVGIATTPHDFGPGLNVAISSAWIAQMRSRGRPQQ